MEVKIVAQCASLFDHVIYLAYERRKAKIINLLKVSEVQQKDLDDNTNETWLIIYRACTSKMVGITCGEGKEDRFNVQHNSRW